MRLQKYMAQCGLASRRKSEKMISQGLVKINGKVVTKLGTTINPKIDIIKVNNKTIKMESRNIYIMLNKPSRYVTTLSDEQDRKIVTDLIEGVKERIFPVGRLDMDTTGLLLLTNDGDITYKLTHPSQEIEKRYIAIVDGTPNRKALERFRKGLFLDGRKTAPARVKILKNFTEDSILEIGIHEGRNRQVKRMCSTIGHPVKKLKRIALGELELGDLRNGNWRYLNSREIEYLNKL